MQDILLENAFTVTQVNRYIKERFAADENLRAITIKGEISNFKNHAKTGHFYFTLKDGESSIKAVMFKQSAQTVKFRAEDGMNVIIRGSVRVFERDGAYQLYCETMDPDGIGALYLAFEQLKKKLENEGLFAPEHKKPIPAFPRRIGVVTAKTGAALQDILNILGRRYPLGTLCLFSALVQGESAPDSIVDAINEAQNNHDIDVLIVGRGGGSMEDLWCFNDEKVAYAIYNCTIPVISAVGHEVDFSISDFVADLRAPTPSAAAELCAPDISVIYDKLENLNYLLNRHIVLKINGEREKLKSCYTRLLSNSPSNRINLLEQRLENGKTRLNSVIDSIISENEHRAVNAVTKLEALSPLKVMTRGYSITKHNGRIVTKAKGLKKGDLLDTSFSDGSITAEVKELKLDKAKQNNKN